MPPRRVLAICFFITISMIVSITSIVLLFLLNWGPRDANSNPLEGIETSVNNSENTPGTKLEGDPSSPQNSQCSKVGCIEAAHYIVQMVNMSADPCEDFFNFACGSFIENAFAKVGTWKSPHEEFYNDLIAKAEYQFFKTPIDELTPAEKKARLYYESCKAGNEVDEEASTTFLREYVQEIGHFALTKKLDVSDDWSLESLLARTLTSTGTAFFQMRVQPDSRNSTHYNLVLEPEVTPVFEHNETLNEATSEPEYLEEVKEAYFTYFEKLFKKILLPKVVVNLRGKYLRRLVNFEIELARIVPNPSLRYRSADDDVQYENFTDSEENRFSIPVSELSIIVPNFKWRNFFQEIGKLHNITSFKMVDDLRITVRNVTYFEEWSNLLQRTMNKSEQLGKERTLNNYVGFRIMADYLPELNCQYSLPFEKMKSKARRQDSSDNIENCEMAESQYRDGSDCLSGLKRAFNNLIARHFIKKYFKKENVDHLTEMTEIIRHGFIDDLKNVEWMDEQTRAAAIKKAKNMLFAVGYPANLFDPDYERQFDSLEISDNFLSNEEHYRHFKKIRELRQLDSLVSRFDYFWDGTDPLERNAYYQPLCNTFGLMAGDNIAPAFHVDYPPAFNWGRAGTTIGHEIMHGFDNFGKDYNDIGQYESWWTEDSLEQFENRTECLIEQYNQFEPDFSRGSYGVHVLPDNIADNGGTKFAYKMFRKTLGDDYLDRVELPGLSYSNEQIFFLAQSFAFCYYYDEQARKRLLNDEHALPVYRINGMMQNSEPWINAFKCPIGSKMNPANRTKCDMW